MLRKKLSGVRGLIFDSVAGIIFIAYIAALIFVVVAFGRWLWSLV